jgi:hypothetical protein
MACQNQFSIQETSINMMPTLAGGLIPEELPQATSLWFSAHQLMNQAALIGAACPSAAAIEANIYHGCYPQQQQGHPLQLDAAFQSALAVA